MKNAIPNIPLAGLTGRVFSTASRAFLLLAVLGLMAYAPPAQAQSSCGFCEESGSGKVTTLLLEYQGTATATDVVFNVRNPNGGIIFGPSNVSPGAVIFLERPSVGHIGNNVEVIVNGTKINEFHTSCSEIINVGDNVGTATYPFVVLAGGDQGDPDICAVVDLEILFDNPSLAAPVAGDVVDFTLALRNNINQGPRFAETGYPNSFGSAGGPWGPPIGSATGVEVTVYIPANLEWVSGGSHTALPASGDGLSGKLTFTPGSVAPDDTDGANIQEFDFRLKVKDDATSNDQATVAAEVTGSDLPDLDSVIDNLEMTVVGASKVASENINPNAVEDDEDVIPFQALPVELVSFEAVLDGRAAMLQWQTLSETNNAGFEVQHRFVDQAHKGASSFEALGFVEGAGTTLEAQSYVFEAERLDPGRHVFRLKQLDFDGTFAYSPEVEVLVEMPDAFMLSSIYPNPFNPTASFSVGVQREQQVEIAVYDVLGRRVLEIYRGVLPAGVTRVISIEASGLGSGTYLLRAVGETFAQTQMFTVVK